MANSTHSIVYRAIRGFVLSKDGIRNLRFEAVDFGLNEEAGDSGVVGAGPGVEFVHGTDSPFFA